MTEIYTQSVTPSNQARHEAGGEGWRMEGMGPKLSASRRIPMTPGTSMSPPGSRTIGLVCLALAGALLQLSCLAAQATCDVCGRDECRALAFRVDYEDGGTERTCCPRCASHAVATSGRKVERLTARDFASGRDTDATTATYVEGSEVEHCRSPREEPADSGCCRLLTYDRCLPSLIAFESASAAESFSRRHGGTLRRFEDLHFGRK